MLIGSDEALCEVHVGLVHALADAFSVAYARYEDFQALETKSHQLATTLHGYLFRHETPFVYRVHHDCINDMGASGLQPAIATHPF
jgi:hypothetical protein